MTHALAGDVEHAVHLFEGALPRHTAGLTLYHNEHKTYFQTVEQWENPDLWVSALERQRAIETQEAWCLYWHPDSSVGVRSVAASTLDAVLIAAQEIGA